jgi:sugar phosphate permease
MGNWFGSKNRGWIFGTWTCHQYLGNIAAAVCASFIIHTASIHWTWALIIPGICNLIWGVVCLQFLPERPEHVGVETEEMAAKALLDNNTSSSSEQQVKNPLDLSLSHNLPLLSLRPKTLLQFLSSMLSEFQM